LLTVSTVLVSGVLIHPSAIVDPGATLGVDVVIGPLAVVEAGAVIGDRTRLMAHTFVGDGCDIGADCEVHVGALIGGSAQIRGFRGPGGGLVIGPRTIVREHVTIHRASEAGRNTVVGREGFLLAGCHIAHDCQIGDGVTIANGTLLAGCVTVGDRAFLSGNVVIHQFVRVGTLSMIGGQAAVGKDVPPFMVVVGRSEVCGVNFVGMRRAGMSSEQRRLVKSAYRILYRSGLNVSNAVARLPELGDAPEIRTLIEFIEPSMRGLCGARTSDRRCHPGRRDPDAEICAGREEN
jgi:UDP-N-acetylglucosamine acyltransferase